MSSSPSPAPEVAVPPPLAVRAVGGFGASIGGGALLGAAAWFADQLGWPLELLLPANLIGVWLAVAFILGGSARTIPTGALRGLIGLVSAVVGYLTIKYFLRYLTHHRLDVFAYYRWALAAATVIWLFRG